MNHRLAHAFADLNSFQGHQFFSLWFFESQVGLQSEVYANWLGNLRNAYKV